MNTFYEAVLAERLRAHEKHGADGNGMESDTIGWDRRMVIVGEEYGEACKALLEMGPSPEMYDELVQLAAMAAATADAVRRVLDGNTLGHLDYAAQRGRIFAGVCWGTYGRPLAGQGGAGGSATVVGVGGMALGGQGGASGVATEVVDELAQQYRERAVSERLAQATREALGDHPRPPFERCVDCDGNRWQAQPGTGRLWWMRSYPAPASMPYASLVEQFGPLVELPSEGEPLAAAVREGRYLAAWRRSFAGRDGQDVGPVFEAQWPGTCQSPRCVSEDGSEFEAGDEIRTVDGAPYHLVCAEAFR